MISVVLSGGQRPTLERTERVKRRATGQKDEITKKPFRIIKIIANNKWGVINQRNSTKGFQDVVLSDLHGKNEILIKYGEAGTGSIEFVCNEDHDFIGELPKTDHNMRMLAAHYYQRWYTYLDDDIEKEVATIADSGEIERNKDIEFQKDHSPYDHIEPDDVNPDKKRAMTAEEKLAKLEAENKALKAEVSANSIYGDKPVDEMNFQELSAECRKRGIKIAPKDKKLELLEKLKNANTGDGNQTPETVERSNQT